MDSAVLSKSIFSDSRFASSDLNYVRINQSCTLKFEISAICMPMITQELLLASGKAFTFFFLTEISLHCDNLANRIGRRAP